MNKYRSHTCGELNKSHKGKTINLSGWINKKRDHGNLLFLDLRDNYGLTQCVIDKSNPIFKKIEKLPLETVIKIEGNVVERTKDTINQSISTGDIEVLIKAFEILGITEGIKWQSVRGKFKELVKKFHPDMNAGSKKFEDKLKVITLAYTQLKNTYREKIDTKS